MDKLSAMHTFRRIVELGSFNAAAVERDLSNAGVSKQLRELERYLGASLLTRTTRRLSLTEAGQAYYRRCLQILDDISEAEAAIAASQALPIGLLRVSAPMSFGLLHLSPLVPCFLRKYTQVTIDLDLNDRVVDLIDDGYDIAIRLRTNLPDSSLVAKKLGSVKRILCAAPAYLKAMGTPVCLNDLLQHHCLVYSLSEDVRGEWTFAAPNGGGLVTVKVQPILSINNSLALRDALLAGIGLSLIPNFVVQPDLDAGRLIPILSDHGTVGHGIHAVYPSSRHVSPKVRAFVDFLSAAYADLTLWSR